MTAWCLLLLLLPAPPAANEPGQIDLALLVDVYRDVLMQEETKQTRGQSPFATGTVPA